MGLSLVKYTKPILHPPDYVDMSHYSYTIKTFLVCLVAFLDFMSPTSFKFKYVAWV